MSALASNSTVTDDTPSRELEVSDLTSSKLPARPRSISFVTNVSMSEAGAPGKMVVTTPTGICTSGADSFGIRERDTKPKMVKAIIAK